MKSLAKLILLGLFAFSLPQEPTLIAEASPSDKDKNDIDLVTGVAELHNDRAETKADCPTDDDWWHFVLTPNNGDYMFVSMNLNLGGTRVVVLLADMVLNNGQVDNVFVAVPESFEITDLMKNGSSAVFEPGGSKVGFVLSHVCEGTKQPTTTTTAAPSTTTTVVPITTTSTMVLPPTTTVVPSTTTSTTIPPTTTTTVVPLTTTTTPETTTTVVQSTITTAPSVTTVVTTTPPTAPPTTHGDWNQEGTDTVPIQNTGTLPNTGLDDNLTFHALWAMVLGGILLTIRRRVRSSS